REDRAAELLGEVALYLHAVLEAAPRRLAGLRDALPGRVVGPAVVGAPQALVGDVAGRQVDTAVGALRLDQAELPSRVAEQHEVLAHEAHRHRLLRLERRASHDRMPVAAQKL